MSLFAVLPRQVSLARQIEAVRRELRLRQVVYPRRIGAGQMNVEKADEELACMAAVLETLEALRDTGHHQGAAGNRELAL